MNKDRFIKRIISVAACAVLAALFIITLFFSAPKITAVPETAGSVIYPMSTTDAEGNVHTEFVTAELGSDVAAVRISDLAGQKLGKITKVNYVADKFVNTRTLSPDIQIVDLTKPFDFAEKGTLIFVIMNLDPRAEDFAEQADSLSEYKIGDYWHFTLSLQNIFCASNVYQNASLIARNGEIANYDFIKFNTSYDKRTEKFSAETATTDIDLQFYTRREVMSNAFGAAQIITIHYQSTGSAYSGIKDAPLIGTESTVADITETSNDLLIAFAIIAAVVFAVLGVLSVLERTTEFVSAVIWIFGITALLFARFILTGTTGVPLFWSALSLAAPFVVLCGALLSVGFNAGKLPLKYIAAALMCMGALFAFICPFIPFEAAGAMGVVCVVIKAMGAVALSAFIGLTLLRTNDGRGILYTACASIIDVAMIASLFMPAIFPTQTNPLFWLCVAATVTTFVSVFIVFTETKRSNVYLTANLHKEVDRQVKDIKAVIQERDRLLQFISHDMKKPLVSSASLIDTLIERERDAEQTKALRIVKQNTARVVNDLSEIAVYAKFNYIAEPAQVVNILELCTELYEFHKPDCDANGIVLKNLADKDIKTFVKKQGLESVVSNLIINAVEHASCSTVTLYVKTEKNNVVLCVADDGKGISNDIDVFSPYVSEKNTETGGLGLYICKSIIESMNGELSFETGQAGTTFYLSLLKA